MRGSPLIRTLVVLLALVAAAVGIQSIAVDPAPAPPAPPEETTASALSASFFLTCSSTPDGVTLESGDETLTLKPETPITTGSLKLAGEHPTVFITVRWSGDDSTTPRFAKLTLEAAGRPTQSRTFDGMGNIEDVWELHFHP